MEQEGGGRGGAGGDGGDKNQPQETTQRGEAAQVEVQAEVQPEPQAPPRLPQQPVQCPRCDSLNTKFCYYNNYSMSQPRYFCKTCRRYWTHGGTLRNVPVGGGCRKGKRGACAKNSPSSSSENSASSSRSNRQQPLPQPQPPSQDQLLVVQAQPPNLTPMVGARDPPPSLGAVPSVTPFFQGGLGGYLSSLGVGGIHHSLSLNPSHPFDQALMNAVGVGGSNLDVVSGFNGANSPGPLRFSQYVQLGGGERDVGPLYPPAEQQSLIPSTMAANSSAAAAAAAAVATHRDWTHRFITNAANNIRATDGSMWSTVSTTNVSGNSQRNVAAATGSSSSASALMMPNQWPNVPGFGPPPSSF